MRQYNTRPLSKTRPKYPLTGTGVGTAAGPGQDHPHLAPRLAPPARSDFRQNRGLGVAQLLEVGR